MHSNANRTASGSNHSNGYPPEPGSSSFPNQFAINTNGMQWSPQGPFPPSVQNNAWPQQQQPQQQQQVPNGMPVGLPVSMQQAPQFNNSLGLLPANILQDVFRLSVPVGSSPNDDTLLVQVLRDSAKRGQTYKQAIETLHGVNNHAANLWKDYYLDHKPRIDNLVSPLADTHVKTVKKPSPFLPPPAARAKSNDSIRTGSSSRVTQAHRPSIKKERISPKPFTSLASKPAAPSKRRTINSITAHEPSLNLKLLPPQADIKLPDPPSRPPTPPTRVVRGSNGGNRYTPEDKEFFIKFIHYELENDPSLTKHDLCVKLAEKVPSHSADSWKSYWSGAHELPDKIFASYDRASSDDGHHPKASAPAPVLKPRPNYVESDSESESNVESLSESVSLSEADSDFEALEELLGADSNDEGESGGHFTMTDLRNVVLHLAAHPNEKESTLWIKFHDEHPQRSDKSWREYYRRNDKEINRYLVKYRIRERTKQTAAPPPQRGRPSWASTSNDPLPSALKRKVSSAGYDGKFKRKKDDDDSE
ncbi:hypothetical protein PILCRDRAFT_817120 [Piloderma croceum F 1598]|uniref:DNA-binding protein RAP1 n=1 Tax=Piloderma croceum (strain F 1598) TaxID=765440 RepID=A0A0C3BFV1_PILCF|nr:hypothetical protein PILCRDRAFT_817120 [Piloderma croceum F 1598]